MQYERYTVDFEVITAQQCLSKLINNILFRTKVNKNFDTEGGNPFFKYVKGTICFLRWMLLKEDDNVFAADAINDVRGEHVEEV